MGGGLSHGRYAPSPEKEKADPSCTSLRIWSDMVYPEAETSKLGDEREKPPLSRGTRLALESTPLTQIDPNFRPQHYKLQQQHYSSNYDQTLTATQRYISNNPPNYSSESSSTNLSQPPPTSANTRAPGCCAV